MSLRSSELTRLKEMIERPKKGLSICSISGPGGIGKSHLMNEVLASSSDALESFLVLRVDGSNRQSVDDFAALVGQLFNSSIAYGDATRDYFPRTRSVLSRFVRQREELEERIGKSSLSADAKQLTSVLVKMGQWGVSKQLRGLPKLNQLEADAVGDLFAAGGSWLAQKLTRASTIRLRHELHAMTAEAIVADLREALVRGRLLRRNLATSDGLTKLLIWVDDYEALQPVLEDFLIGALVPALASCEFDTVLWISGRDDLEDGNGDWSRQYKRHLEPRIRLRAFDEAMTRAMLKQLNVDDAKAEQLFNATRGYPLLLQLLAEELTDGETGSALAARKFFERTTRWMTAEEVEWFTRVCYLDRVNEDTLGRLFPKEKVAAIQSWFEKEPSIRDPNATEFVVRPLIREKVLRYQELRSPTQHRELLQNAGNGSISAR
ncbi:MAG: hypothetical protein ACO1OB_31515 [Archangium sp.]